MTRVAKAVAKWAVGNRLPTTRMHAKPWDGRLGGAEYILLLLSIGTLLWFVPRFHALAFITTALAVYAIGESSLSRRRKLVALLVVLGAFVYLKFQHPRPVILAIQGGLEALFVLRCIDFALRQRSDTLMLGTADRFGRFILWLFFFPTLFVGPPYSYRDFYQSHHLVSVNRPQVISAALRKILWGGMKAALLAPSTRFLYKRLLAASTLEAAPGGLPLLPRLDPYLLPLLSQFDPGLLIWAAFCLDLIRFYLALSGYWDIATGVTRLLGFNVYDNFDRPLLSTSPVRYWQTMDIAVYRWMMIHVFFPFWGHTRISAKVITTFIASGLWHLMVPLHFSWDSVLQIGLAYGIRGVVVAALMSFSLTGWGLRQDFAPQRPWVTSLVRASQVALTFSFTALVHPLMINGVRGVPVVTTMAQYRHLFFGPQ